MRFPSPPLVALTSLPQHGPSSRVEVNKSRGLGISVFIVLHSLWFIYIFIVVYSIQPPMCSDTVAATARERERERDLVKTKSSLTCHVYFCRHRRHPAFIKVVEDDWCMPTGLDHCSLTLKKEAVEPVARMCAMDFEMMCRRRFKLSSALCSGFWCWGWGLGFVIGENIEAQITAYMSP